MRKTGTSDKRIVNAQTAPPRDRFFLSRLTFALLPRFGCSDSLTRPWRLVQIVLLFLVLSPLTAAGETETIIVRKSLMSIIASSVKILELGISDRASIAEDDLQKAGRILANAGALIAPSFATQTSPNADIKTQAKPNIWDDWRDFSTRAKRFSADAAVLSDALAKSDRRKAIAALRSINASCGSCHRVYRQRK